MINKKTRCRFGGEYGYIVGVRRNSSNSYEYVFQYDDKSLGHDAPGLEKWYKLFDGIKKDAGGYYYVDLSQLEILEEGKMPSKLDRIKELEKQLAELRKDVEREEMPSFPYFAMSKHSGVVFRIREGEAYNRAGVLDHSPFASSVPFTGAIHYKNGKPVKTVEEEN